MAGVLLPGGEDGVAGTLLGSGTLAEDTSVGGGWIVLTSGVFSSASTSTDLTVYISLSTTSRLKSLLDDFSLCAYLQ